MAVIPILLLLCIAALSHDPLSRYTQEELDFLANLSFSQIPRHIQLKLSKSGKTLESGFCCKADITKLVPFVTVTHVVPKTHVVAIHHGDTVGYEHRVTTFLQHDYIPNKSVCPDNLIVCCRNHILLSGACFDITSNDVITSVDDLIKLQQQGVDIGRR